MSTAPLLLIVDDSRTSRMLIRGMVSKLRPDWRITEAGSGDEALQKCEEELPQFVSMDVNMPGMSGLEAAAKIRMRHAEVRIVLCTANIQEAIRDAAAKAGIQFVAKPITPVSVEQSIQFFEG